jgi:hypothetical protein
MSGVMGLFLVARRCEEVRVERITDDGIEGPAREECAEVQVQVPGASGWVGGGRDGARRA